MDSLRPRPPKEPPPDDILARSRRNSALDKSGPTDFSGRKAGSAPSSEAFGSSHHSSNLGSNYSGPSAVNKTSSHVAPFSSAPQRGMSELAIAQQALDQYATPDYLGRYTLVKSIGKGAYGAVYVAHEHVPGEPQPRKVAIKHIVNAFVSPTDARRIYREIKVMSHFSHPNIIGLHEVIRPRDPIGFSHIYLVSELMETDLHRVINRKQDLTSDHISYFIYQILCALKHIHSAGVLHRDMKPSNLLVNADCTVKMCDFGLARESDSTLSAALTEYVVTRWYRAPEVLLSGGRYTQAIDIWAVGCILAELLLRRPMFPGTNYLHQLQLITEILGTPSEADLEFVTSIPARSFMTRLPFSSGIPFHDIFPHVRGPCLDLLQKMLIFSPEKRIDVDSAQAHPFLARVRTARAHVNEHVPSAKPFKMRISGGSAALRKMPVELMKARFFSELCGLPLTPSPSSAPSSNIGLFLEASVKPQVDTGAAALPSRYTTNAPGTDSPARATQQGQAATQTQVHSHPPASVSSQSKDTLARRDSVDSLDGNTDMEDTAAHQHHSNPSRANSTHVNGVDSTPGGLITNNESSHLHTTSAATHVRYTGGGAAPTGANVHVQVHVQPVGEAFEGHAGTTDEFLDEEVVDTDMDDSDYERANSGPTDSHRHRSAAKNAHAVSHVHENSSVNNNSSVLPAPDESEVVVAQASSVRNAPPGSTVGVASVSSTMDDIVARASRKKTQPLNSKFTPSAPVSNYPYSASASPLNSSKTRAAPPGAGMPPQGQAYSPLTGVRVGARPDVSPIPNIMGLPGMGVPGSSLAYASYKDAGIISKSIAQAVENAVTSSPPRKVSDPYGSHRSSIAGFAITAMPSSLQKQSQQKKPTGSQDDEMNG